MPRDSHGWLVSVSAIVGIAVLESIALCRGHDGALLLVSFTVIGGIAGYEIGKLKGRLK